ncbi:MAG: TrkA C-terminal domain-containing protein [Actinomycetota bacterium]|nr:TrkA C-terminal domain-containing protein [Actinomycetota bacterium]
MFAIGSVLVIVAISVVITRVGTAALTVTGVSDDLAYFQARSAFTGVGFTTSEAETVVNHPVRRRIILVLMLLSNAGIATVIASLVVGFVNTDSTRVAAARLAVLAVGLAILWLLTASDPLERVMRRSIERGLRRWASGVSVRDYTRLLNVSGPYAVQEHVVEPDDWLADTPLRDLDLANEGVLVLGVRRSSGEFLGVPAADTRLRPGDTVVMYGRDDPLAELSRRQAGVGGEHAHREAVDTQERVQAHEEAADPDRAESA